MGTKALTVVKGNDGQKLAVLYRKFDGWPGNYGFLLAKVLQEFGAEAYYIGESEELGNSWVGDGEQIHCDYTYSVYFEDEGVSVEVARFDEVIFSGTVDDFYRWSECLRSRP